MGDLLAFRKMITPWVIQLVFWAAVLATLGAGLVTLITGEGLTRLTGLLMIVGGPLVARIYCELFIVAFRINDALTEIRDNTTPATYAGERRAV